MIFVLEVERCQALFLLPTFSPPLMNHDEEDLESVNSDDDEEIFTSVDHFINHACFGELTLGQLQRAFVTFPNFKEDLLHFYLGTSAPCSDEGGVRNEEWPARNIDIEVVKYLLELAPEALERTSCFEVGALPLHLACRNADCPEAIIKLLLQKYLSAAEHKWKKGYSYPLQCYIARAIVHPAWGYHDDDGERICCRNSSRTNRGHWC
jgi:hypothetical protein